MNFKVPAIARNLSESCGGLNSRLFARRRNRRSSIQVSVGVTFVELENFLSQPWVQVVEIIEAARIIVLHCWSDVDLGTNQPAEQFQATFIFFGNPNKGEALHTGWSEG